MGQADGRTDGRQTVTLRFPQDAVGVNDTEIRRTARKIPYRSVIISTKVLNNL